MTLPTSLLLLLLASILPSISASPIALKTHIHHKRAPSSHNIGIGFAIALSVLFLASTIFYLGVQRGRTGTWFSFRAAPPTEKSHPTIDTDMLKSRISSPIQMHSSALPELSPLEAQPPQYAELPSPMEEKEKPSFLPLSATQEKEVFEMGIPSPRRPPSVASTEYAEGKSFYSSRKSSFATAYRKSVASVKTTGKSVYSTHEKPPRVNSWFERKSWFCRGAMEVEDEEKKIRGKEGGEDVVAVPVVAPPPKAVVADREEVDRRQTAMDWSGMEWLAKVYNGRKSRRLSGMRSFFISDEK